MLFRSTNDAPVAQSLNLETNEDTSVSFELLANDVDGDILSFDIVSNPRHGTLIQNGSNQWIYTPFEQFSGTDRFTYRPFDGSVHGNHGSVQVSILEVNDAPIVQSSTFHLKEDGNIAIKLIASDPEGDSLTFAITSEPANGILLGNEIGRAHV